MSDPGPAVFALNSCRTFGEAVVSSAAMELMPHEEREFEDGEFKIRPMSSVRNRDVFVIQSLYSDAQQSVCEKLCRLLFFTGALRDACADRITLVLPYLCFSRKDQKSRSRDPVTTRYVASMLEAVGASQVVTMDVHNLSAFQNAFRIPTEHLEARRLFADQLSRLALNVDLVVVSPDIGGTKRANALRETLCRQTRQVITSAWMDKHRSAGVVSGDAVIGEVEGRTVIVVDDMISRGTTLARTARACRQHGALQVYAIATHGLFAADAEAVLSTAPIDHIVVTNSVTPGRLSKEFQTQRVQTVSVAPLFGEAIRRMHEGRSLVELAEGN